MQGQDVIKVQADDCGQDRLHSFDKGGIQPVFQFVSSRYEKRSTIHTSNKSLKVCGKFLSDTVMTSADLDRILHHRVVINIID